MKENFYSSAYGGIFVHNPLASAVMSAELLVDKLGEIKHGEMYEIVKTFRGFELPEGFTKEEYKELYEFWKNINL